MLTQNWSEDVTTEQRGTQAWSCQHLPTLPHGRGSESTADIGRARLCLPALVRILDPVVPAARIAAGLSLSGPVRFPLFPSNGIAVAVALTGRASVPSFVTPGMFPSGFSILSELLPAPQCPALATYFNMATDRQNQ